jgi:hypothetical protein
MTEQAALMTMVVVEMIKIILEVFIIQSCTAKLPLTDIKSTLLEKIELQTNNIHLAQKVYAAVTEK